MKPISKVAIIGGGTMGSDLAALIAREDIPVAVKEVNQELADSLIQRFNDRVDSWETRGKISRSKADQIKMLFSATASYSDIHDADLVIEAIPENIELKKRVFKELSRELPEAILTSNTSSIPISLLVQEVVNPEKMAGLHFFNPPTRMMLVELISTPLTSSETRESLQIFATESLRKVPILVKDRPGFLINVVLGGYLAPAIQALEKTKLTPEDIDASARQFGWPMGPFTLLDLLGVDVAAEVMAILSKAYSDRFTNSELLWKMVKAGLLGQKSGQGFFGSRLGQIRNEFIRQDDLTAEKIFEQMMFNMVNECAVALQDNTATANDIEVGCRLGLGFPQIKEGPLHYADEIGISKIVEGLGNKACDLLKAKADEGSTFFESL